MASRPIVARFILFCCVFAIHARDSKKMATPTKESSLPNVTGFSEGIFMTSGSQFSIIYTDEAPTTTSIPTDELSTKYRIFVITSMVVYSILSAIVCIGNLLIIVAFIRSGKLKTKSNLTIFHLALGDLFFGIALINNIEGWISGRGRLFNGCVINLSVNTFCAHATANALMLLTYDRFKSIMWPLTYNSSLNRNHCIVISCLVWVPAFVFGFLMPMVLRPDHYHIPDIQICSYTQASRRDVFGTIMLPWLFMSLLVIALLYIPIIVTSCRHSKAISRQIIPHINSSNETVNPEREHFRKSLKLVKTVAIIFVTFYGTWLPYLVAVASQVYSDKIYNDFEHVAFSVSRYTGYILHVASVVNPFIYPWRQHDFRDEIRALFRFNR